jgi:hypothetical protein
MHSAVRSLVRSIVPWRFAKAAPEPVYDEALVRRYTLPELLRPAATISDWEVRREQILELFRTEMFGRDPGRDGRTNFTVEAIHRDALGGKAVRKLVLLEFGGGVTARMQIHLPSHARPAPVFLALCFAGNETIHPDPAIPLGTEWVRDSQTRRMLKRRVAETSRGRFTERWQLETLLEQGYGLATIDYQEIEPDFIGGFEFGVRGLYLAPGEKAPGSGEWGAIAAWAWGLSRAMDYLETDEDVDPTRVAVFGHSRLAKTALWAGAEDERFSLVISNESGTGGAAILRRGYGERIKSVNARCPHWFCGNLARYNDREDEMPFDAHFLLALIAPRPLYVASSGGAPWCDPRGEFLAAYHASRVYELLGRQGIPTDQVPGNYQPILNTVAYHMRGGKHDVTAYSWEQYLKFAHLHWGPPNQQFGEPKKRWASC